MKTKWALVAAIMFAAAAHSPAHADVQLFTISGGGISSSFELTYQPNPNTGVLPGTSPNPVDPLGSYVITGITGTFSDSNIGLFDVLITGIVPSNPTNPQPTNLLAPHSFIANSPSWCRTQWLFMPPLTAVRRDARFAALCEKIGLARYWRQRGVGPDHWDRLGELS